MKSYQCPLCRRSYPRPRQCEDCEAQVNLAPQKIERRRLVQDSITPTASIPALRPDRSVLYYMLLAILMLAIGIPLMLLLVGWLIHGF